MSISTGTILRIVAVLAFSDGDIAQNVFNLVITGAGAPWDEDDVVTDMSSWVQTMFGNLNAKITSSLAGSEVRVYEYDSVDDDFDEVGSTDWSWAGTNASGQLPRGVAALINAKSSDPDVNGKKYLAGMCEDSVTQGLIESDDITAFANFADDWVTPFTGGVTGATCSPGIWSPTRTNFYLMSGTVILPTICAYQRRRKRGVGI